MEYKLKIKLIEPMLGTVPKDKEVYATYIATKAQNAELVAEEIESVEQIEEKGWTGFHKDEKGLFIYDYMIRGFLKEAANILKDSLKIKNLKSKFNNYVFVHPRKIYFNKEKPDGVLERPLRCMTIQGPRVTVTRSDYVLEGTEIEATITILGNKEINHDVLQAVLEYGKFQGLGQWRNGSYGRFEFELSDALPASKSPKTK